MARDTDNGAKGGDRKSNGRWQDSGLESEAMIEGPSGSRMPHPAKTEPRPTIQAEEIRANGIDLGQATTGYPDNNAIGWRPSNDERHWRAPNRASRSIAAAPPSASLSAYEPANEELDNDARDEDKIIGPEDGKELAARGENNSMASNWAQQADGIMCRFGRDNYLDLERYKDHSCVNCYLKVPAKLVTGRLIRPPDRNPFVLHDKLTGSQVLPNETALINQTFYGAKLFDQWQSCCQEAVKCCLRNKASLRAVFSAQANGLVDDRNRSDACPGTWDSLSCWPETPANTIAEHQCPEYAFYTGYQPVCSAVVYKSCLANGSWFIRSIDDKEWSDYTRCTGLRIEHLRMTVGSILYALEVLFVMPALFIMNRQPNRGSSKRMRILSNIVFWLLVNAIVNSCFKGLITVGLFKSDEPNNGYYHSTASKAPANEPLGQQALARLTANNSFHDLDYLSGKSSELGSIDAAASNGQLAKLGPVNGAPNYVVPGRGSSGSPLGHEQPAQLGLTGHYPPLERLTLAKPSLYERPKPPPNPRLTGTEILRQIVCWILSNGIRVTRALAFQWMFTGAIYLCAVLHFAPAEPPNAFIRLLMILSDALPLADFLFYLMVRTIVEPSPLNLLAVPYYYLTSNMKAIDVALRSGCSCWVFRADEPRIEYIIEIPHLILLFLNIGLFLATLFIVCRITRPGCTRHEMSVYDYSRAAGTLVVLYGIHYIAYTGGYSSQMFGGCLESMIFYYIILFMETMQGVIVSYVFCYKTPETKELVAKWWSNLRGKSWSRLSTGSRLTTIKEEGTICDTLDCNNRSIRYSGRSNNSICNGKDVTTELLDVDENTGPASHDHL